MKPRLSPTPLILVFLTFFLFQANSVFAIDPVFNNFWGQAIRGYDSVAYFKEGKPVEGKKQFQHEWKGAKWLFSSQQNRDEFAKDPNRYAPQYGGYCAWAVSQGYTASIDPEAWSIRDGKLYLNYSKKVQETWNKDIPGHIQRANQNWPSLVTSK